MIRVNVFVEGQTEETFVRELLYAHFQRQNIYLNPILVRTSSTGKGGVDCNGYWFGCNSSAVPTF
ncbi:MULTISPECIES: DUF4276 family protein [unclassified Anabaena]|uniref:DUF4276 family protein n=1 Tax=unclassified Anabaena TaxID=2619674 RepID=UPI0015809A63|nr:MULTISPECIES: DUF4276 family protein [unclassified Anabaena]MTJ08497.1 hypothetical protein [Anabaena sp. UHCC 0204]MTJ52922.1 hypothetical protein [Anabaena sp. UHCC 0253]